MNDVSPEYKTRPQWLAVKAFAGAILIGFLLLSLPISHSDGNWTDPVTALFTATSATCVTGLIVVDTGTYFSRFGQIVILLLIQLGGLGIMTFGTLLLTMVGRRPRMKEEFLLKDSLGREHVRGLKVLLLRSFAITFILEAIGAAVISMRLLQHHGMSRADAIYHGIFHSISAFCNAGFSLYSDSLIGFRTDRILMLTVIMLIITGGLGFIVLFNLTYIKFWHRDLIRRERLTLHSRLVLVSSLILILWGWGVFLFLEWNNTLGSISVGDKILCALFESVTPRTAGFNVVPTGAMRASTLFHTMALMFIGGSPASTAGGIKTTTAVVLVMTVITMIRGRVETEVYRRRIPVQVVREALSIFLLSAFFIIACFSILLLTEDKSLIISGRGTPDALLFEIISAFGTVGLSTGITSMLSVAGRLMLVVCMFVGRLGPLTVAMIIGAHEVVQALHYPREEVIVG